MLDKYLSSTGQMMGWDAYKAFVVSTSGGVLDSSSTDQEVKTHLESSLAADYGSSVF